MARVTKGTLRLLRSTIGIEDLNGGAVLDIWVLAVRALSFCAALHAAGVPLFISLLGGELGRVHESALMLARRSAWAGLLLVAMYQVSEPIRLLGDLRGVLDVSLQGAVLEFPLGTVAVLGSAFAITSFAFMGHSPTTIRGG